MDVVGCPSFASLKCPHILIPCINPGIKQEVHWSQTVVSPCIFLIDNLDKMLLHIVDKQLWKKKERTIAFREACRSRQKYFRKSI